MVVEGCTEGASEEAAVLCRRRPCAVPPPPLVLPWQQWCRRSRPPLSAGFLGNGEAGPSVVVVGGGEPSELLPRRCHAPARGLTAAPTPENVKGRSRADDPAAEGGLPSRVVRG